MIQRDVTEREKEEENEMNKKNAPTSKKVSTIEIGGTLRLEFGVVFLSLFWSHYILLHHAHSFLF